MLLFSFIRSIPFVLYHKATPKYAIRLLSCPNMSVEIKQKSKLLGRFLDQNSEKSCAKIHEKSRQNFFDLAPYFFGNGAFFFQNMRHVFLRHTPSFFAAGMVGYPSMPPSHDGQSCIMLPV